MNKIRGFFNSLMDKFLSVLKLDEPIEKIESIVQRTTLVNYSDALLSLSVQTDLTCFRPSEAFEYTLRLELDSLLCERSMFYDYVSASDPESPERLWDYITTEGVPTIGLTRVLVHFETTTLEFKSLINPKQTYRCYISNTHVGKIVITDPISSAAGLYDARFGRYDRLELTSFCICNNDIEDTKTLDMVKLSYYLGDELTYREIVQKNAAQLLGFAPEDANAAQLHLGVTRHPCLAVEATYHNHF